MTNQKQIICQHCHNCKFHIKLARDPIVSCAECHAMFGWPDGNPDGNQDEAMTSFWEYDKKLYEENGKIRIGIAKDICYSCKYNAGHMEYGGSVCRKDEFPKIMSSINSTCDEWENREGKN